MVQLNVDLESVHLTNHFRRRDVGLCKNRLLFDANFGWMIAGDLDELFAAGFVGAEIEMDLVCGDRVFLFPLLILSLAAANGSQDEQERKNRIESV